MKGCNRRVTLILPLVMTFLWLPTLSLGQIPPGSTIDFGQQTIGTTSSEMYVTTICCGGSGETFSFSVTGHFRRGPNSTCGSSLPLGGSCNFYVVFLPQQVGTENGQVRFSLHGCPFGCLPDTIWNLTGTGVAPPPPLPPPPPPPRVEPFTLAYISYCQGSFNAGPCATAAASTGAQINASGIVSTSGEFVNYTASSVSLAGQLGGSVSLMSQTLNSSGPGIMVDALEETLDVITISFPPFNGEFGTMELLYTLHGDNTASGVDTTATFGPHRVPYACVKLGINQPVFPFGCVAHDAPQVAGTFSRGFVQFVYGRPFPLWFQLESIAGTGFGPGRPVGEGSSAASFLNTATIAPFVLFDPDMKPLEGTPTITSELGIASYLPVPFAEFRPKLEIARAHSITKDGRDLLEFEGFGRLGQNSNGVDPANEDVIFRVGPLSLRIPQGSFVARGRDDEPEERWNREGAEHLKLYSFRGIIEGLPVEAEINIGPMDNFVFRLSARHANVGPVVNPIDVGLSIGGDVGNASIRAEVDRDR
jgi:hypothetical protein